jgi:polysaccharide deacetylase 2 family uncharacterized protein YibQ
VLDARPETTPPPPLQKQPSSTEPVKPARVETAPPAMEPPHQDAPLLAYAVPSVAPANRPGLAIVIDDMGLDRTHALQAIALPGPLTLSLMTYAADLQGLAKQARAAGHEVLAHVPMEPLDRKEHPGPHALTVAMDDATIRAELGSDLDGWQGYVGVNNHMGSRFTADRARMDVVMAELKRRGLLWLDSKTTTNSTGPAAARAAGVPLVERDVFLDNTQTVAAVTAEMENAIAAAKAHGYAVAIGHPHEATIAALKQILPTLEARGVVLVPVSDVLKRREIKVRG